MDKVEVKQHVVEDRIHHFYCDHCNDYLGETREYDEGWYPKLGEFELKIFLLDGWHTSKKCLCDECKIKYSRKVANVLQELGFDEELRDYLEEETFKKNRS